MYEEVRLCGGRSCVEPRAKNRCFCGTITFCVTFEMFSIEAELLIKINCKK